MRQKTAGKMANWKKSLMEQVEQAANEHWHTSKDNW